MAIKHLKVSGKVDGADPTLVQPSDWNAGHVSQFRIVTAGESLVESDGILTNIASNQTFALPASVSVGAQFLIRNSAVSAGFASIDPGAGRSIDYAPGRSLGTGVALVCAPGETLLLVAKTATGFEVVDRTAPTLLASLTISPASMFEVTQTVTSPSITPSSRVFAWFAPNADWDADDLAGYSVLATPGVGIVTFLISAPGPIVGSFDINYSWN